MVCSKIQDKIYEELKRLSASFGIGVILLDVNNPENSRIEFPAKYSDKLDWNAIQRLLDMQNEDIEKFFKHVASALKLNDPEQAEKIISIDEVRSLERIKELL